MTDREAREQLQQLYDQVPSMKDCQGTCWISCGPLGMSEVERKVVKRAGYHLPDKSDLGQLSDTYWCPALTGDGKCAIYDLRPLVCRLWGVVPSMPCPYGCQPERWLTEEEGQRLLITSLVIGGSRNVSLTLDDIEPYLSMWRRTQELHDAFMEVGQTGEKLRLAEFGRVIPPEVARRKPLRKRRESL